MTGSDRERALTPSGGAVLWIWVIAVAAAVIVGVHYDLRRRLDSERFRSTPKTRGRFRRILSLR
jgi:hypothetical protein